MKKHEILSPQSRAALFDPSTEPAAIVRYYTFSPDDLAVIKRRRGEANRLGFAVHLAYFRYPGRIIGVDEAPPEDMLRFIADQIGGRVEDFHDYARRAQTRREHLGELRAYANLRLAREDDARVSFKAALEEATGTDRGDAIVTAMIVNLLPSPMELERLALAARARARQQAHKALTDDLDHEKTKGLTSLIEVDDESHTPLAWLREWSEAPRQKNLVGIIERLQSIRKLGVGPDRENRIHRARYAAIARETAILSAQHLSRFDTHRRLAALVVFAREMESTLTDAGITMFDKMLGGVFRRAENAHKENIVDRAKTLDASTRALIGMAKAMLAAKESGEDQVAVVERVLGWERLKTMMAEADKVVGNTRVDNLGEMVERFATVRRMSPVVLDAFTFRSWKPDDSLLAALDVVRDLHVTGAKKLPPRAPTAFLKPAWRKLVGTGNAVDRRAYEVAVMTTLRDRLRSGDVWVEGSRAFRPFDDFLLPKETFAARRRDGELSLAVPESFEDWRAERVKLLDSRFREIDALAAAGELREATLTEEGLSISAIRKDETDASENTARRLYGMLPRVRITELLAEVHGWTDFAERFSHLRTGAPPEDNQALMTALLADATSL